MTNDEITCWATPREFTELTAEVTELRAFRDAIGAALGHAPSELPSNTELLAEFGRDPDRPERESEPAMNEDELRRWATAPMEIDQLRSDVGEFLAFRDTIATSLGYTLGRHPQDIDNGALIALIKARLADAARIHQHDHDIEQYADFIHRLTQLANEFQTIAGRHGGPDGTCGAQLSAAWDIAAYRLREVLGVPKT